jgi:hypothetical protein
MHAGGPGTVQSKQMARPVRALLALVALGVGCASQTIDLLAPADSASQGGGSGSATAGTQAGSSPNGGAGGRSTTGVGGASGRGGSGFVVGGTGNVGTGGGGGESGENLGGASSTSCTMNIDCPMNEPYCLPIQGTARSHCRECVQHIDCAIGQRCNFLTNECAPSCTTFDDCPSSAPFCERGVCIQCVQDSHCVQTRCVFGHCEECRSNFDCAPSAPYCNPDSYTCRPCTGMYQCGNGRYCVLTTGRCEFF